MRPPARPFGLRRRLTEDVLEPSPELAALTERVERMLQEAVGRCERVADRFEVPYRNTRVIVHPLQWTRERTLLRFIAPIVLGVTETPALHRKLSDLNHGTVFGKFYVMDGTVWIEHNLLGESLDQESFRAALASVAHHADHLDEPLMAEFGGHRWSERG